MPRFIDRRFGLVVTAIVTVASGLAVRLAAARAEDQLTPVLAAVLAPPAAVPQSDGQWTLPYEIELTNVTNVPMTIESVEARDPDRGGTAVAALTGDGVAPYLALPGGVKSATLGPGQSAVLFINATFARRADVPKKLEHRIVVTTPDPKPPLPARTVEDVAAASVVDTEPIVVGPPLRGERWVAAASCCDSYHRRAVLPVNGARHLAQRFAIDWIQLDPQGRLATGDPSRNESYPQFGADAIAVADAVVVLVQDGLPEGKPGAFPASVSATTADGNSVVLDLGGGHYALYAHLQPGSIRVKKGDRVTRGQVLGLVGNTGNSDAPHLHFHVMDSPSPLASNGVPYVIDGFEITGRAVSATDLDRELKSPDKPVDIVPVDGPVQRTNELPADLVVVRFPS
jgi:hypothetical protein